jgi:hypothetical protein
VSKNGKTTDVAALESEAFAEALEGAKTPGEKLALIYAKQSRDEQRRQTEILSAQHRMQGNATTAGQEKMKQADEDREAEILTIRECSVPVDVPLELDLADAPLVLVRIELVGERRGDGPHRIHGVRWTAGGTAEADRLLLEELWKPWLDQKAELTKLADAAGLAALTKHVEGRSHARGFQHVKWLSVTKAILLKLIRPNGTLEDLLRRAVCQLAGEIVYADAPPRGTVHL